MALLTFPLALEQFFDLLPIARAPFELPEHLVIDETAGGEVLPADIGTTLWQGSIDLDVMTHEEASAIRPLINLIRRSAASFMIADPMQPGPKADPTGIILDGTAPTILAIGASMQELSLSGLPARFPICRGDRLSFEYRSAPTRYALHEVVSDVIEAGTNGETAMIQVNPPIRPGAIAGTEVQLIWPRCKARLIPGENSTGTPEAGLLNGARFQWRQTLR